MNYWPAEPTGLGELTGPFYDLVDSLRASGRRTAREAYGADGFVTHYTTDAWWNTEPEGRAQWGMWVMGGAWSTRHLWEHWLFSRDRDFLRARTWPALRDASEFLLEVLATFDMAQRGYYAANATVLMLNETLEQRHDMAKLHYSVERRYHDQSFLASIFQNAFYRIGLSATSSRVVPWPCASGTSGHVAIKYFSPGSMSV